MAEQERLSIAEKKVFDEEWPFLGNLVTQDRKIRDVMENNYEAILQAAEVAKAKLKATFVGEDAGGSGDFAAMLIRPEFLLRLTTDTGVTNTTWEANYTATGWQNWIGTAAAFNRIDEEELVLCQLGYLNYAPAPKVTAVQPQVNAQQYGIDYIEYQMRKGDGLATYILKHPRIWAPGTRLYFQVKVDATGLDELSIFGIAFVLGTTNVTQTPTLESP